MSSRDERLTRLVLILAAVSALVYLSTFLWKLGEVFSDLILLLALAWLVAYILSPVARWLNQGPIPRAVVDWVRGRTDDRVAGRLRAFGVPYGLAAVLLYLLVLSSLVLIIVLVVPGIIVQLGQLARQVPSYIDKLPEWWEGMQDQIVEQFNVDRGTLAEAVPIETLTDRLTAALPDVLGNAVTVLQRVVGAIANILLVLIFSLYIMLDSERLSQQFSRVVPVRYQDEFEFLFKTISRTFGGFLRGQVLMALSQGVFTAVVMRLFGLEFTMITAILSGLVMFIPELGAPLAMLAPAVASALQGSDATIPILVVTLTFQQILLRFVVPKVMSEAIGMPPLLVLVSVLVGGRIMGLWGFFFSIPVAGVLYTVVIVTLEQVKRNADAQEWQEPGEPKAELNL